MANAHSSTITTFAGTAPANATALPDASSRTDIETRARQISFVDFAADDSGAIVHVITDAPRVFPWFGERQRQGRTGNAQLALH